MHAPPLTPHPRRPGAAARLRGWVRAQLSQPLLRNAYTLMAAATATQTLGVAYWAVATHHYTEEQVGQGSAAISAMRLLSGFVALYLTGILTRYVPLAGRFTRPLVSWVYLISVAGSILVSLVFLLQVESWAPSLSFLRDSLAAVGWFCLAVAAWSVVTLQDYVLAGLRRTIWVTIVTTAFSLAKLALLVVLAAPLPRDGVFLSWTISALLALIPLNVLVYRRFLPRRTGGAQALSSAFPLRQLGTFAAAEYTSAMSVQAAQMLPPVLVAAMFDATTTAYFYMPWLIGTALQILPRHMATSLTVESCSDAARLAEYARTASRRIALLLGPVILVTVAAAPQILLVFGGAYASAGARLLQLVTLALVPTAAVELYVGIARAQGRPGAIAAVQGALSILLLALALGCASLWGVAGVGVAVLASYTMVAVAILPRLRAVLTATGRTAERGRP